MSFAGLRPVSHIQSVAALIRRAKAVDPRVRISDFQIRVERDRTALVNLKTGAVRILSAGGNERFDAFCNPANGTETSEARLERFQESGQRWYAGATNSVRNRHKTRK
jgi:hypothetical protein